MKSRDPITSRIMFFLSDKDKLALRRVSKWMKDDVKNNQHDLYKNKAEFVLAIADIFYSQKYFEAAWKLYSKTAVSTSFYPAMLYKLKDLTLLFDNGLIQSFSKGEDLFSTGRKYCPVEHAWDTNQVWVLAQIHKGRAFTMLSELSPQYVMRGNYPGVFSAFAKEVAMAIKAGYEVSINAAHQIQLNPDKYTDAAKFRFDELTPTEQEIKSAVKIIDDSKLEHRRAVQIARGLKKLFGDIENYPLDELQQLHANLDETISSKIDLMILNAKYPKLVMNSFVNEFNNNNLPSIKKFDSPKLIRFFDRQNKVKKVKECIICALSNRVNELMVTMAETQLTDTGEVDVSNAR